MELRPYLINEEALAYAAAAQESATCSDLQEVEFQPQQHQLHEREQHKQIVTNKKKKKVKTTETYTTKLKKKDNLEMNKIPGDGHCLLRCFTYHLNNIVI